MYQNLITDHVQRLFPNNYVIPSGNVLEGRSYENNHQIAASYTVSAEATMTGVSFPITSHGENLVLTYDLQMRIDNFDETFNGRGYIAYTPDPTDESYFDNAETEASSPITVDHAFKGGTAKFVRYHGSVVVPNNIKRTDGSVPHVYFVFHVPASNSGQLFGSVRMHDREQHCFQPMK